MTDKKYRKAYAIGEKYLKEQAQVNNWQYYSIVEDSYKYENGLLLIGYEDELSMRGDKDNPSELGSICIDLEDYEEV